MKKYFVYDDEYISGNTYFIRFFLNSFLALILVGLYLQSVNSYKRGRSLGFGKDASIAWAIWGFLQYILGLFPTALFTNVIPHFYLWFSNGKTKSKDEKIKETIEQISELGIDEGIDIKEEKIQIESEKKVDEINEILNENPIPKTLKSDSSSKSSSNKTKTVSNKISSENLLNNFEKKLEDLTKPDAFLYDYKYWYKFVQGRATSIPIPSDKTDKDFIEEQSWAHCDEYSKRLFSETAEEKITFVEPRIVCYGKIYDLLLDLGNDLKSNNASKNITTQNALEILHGKASLYGAIKFAQKNSVSNQNIKKWYPNFSDDVGDVDAPFLEKIRPLFVGEDAQSKLFPIYDLNEAEKGEIPFWFKKGLFIFGFFKKGKTIKKGSKSIKLNRLERSMFFHYQQFCMLLEQLPQFNKDGSYYFGKYEFYIETYETKELIISYFENNNKKAADFLEIKSKQKG